MSVELWEQQSGLAFMAHWTTRVKSNQWAEAEIDVIANISTVLVFWYFISRHSCSGTRASRVRECKAVLSSCRISYPLPIQPHPRILAAGPDQCYLILTYRVYWAHFPMLHYPRGRGVSTGRYFYYLPKGGYIELHCKLTLLLCSPLLPRTRQWTPRRN